MNPCFVTQHHRSSQDPKEIEHDWHAGKEFRVYHFANIITINNSLQLRMASFTHVRVVYLDLDLQARALDIELQDRTPTTAIRG